MEDRPRTEPHSASGGRSISGQRKKLGAGGQEAEKEHWMGMPKGGGSCQKERESNIGKGNVLNA